MDLCQTDLRCLDAHAHLGNLAFDRGPKDAMRHYEAGYRIGELSLGEGFDGVLPWGRVDNRPFLRCMNLFGLCLWRLGRFEEVAHLRPHALAESVRQPGRAVSDRRGPREGTVGK
jgi:hypothetical protein